MSPVESYQRIDLQNTDETIRQFNKKSIDQANAEIRIENHSVHIAIEDSEIASGNIIAGNGGDEVKATTSVGNEAVSVSNASKKKGACT